MSLHAVLMAGGSGTRFWPVSRKARPKQLLPVAGELPMLVETSRRLLPLIPPERQFVITSARYVDAVCELLPDVPREQVIGEPEGRDTAPCIGLAAWLVERLDADATVVAMPSDHVIRPEALFREHLAVAEAALAQRPGALLVFGIEPDHAATGYGWLRAGEPALEAGGKSVLALAEFVEKPPRERAEAMLAAGGHTWNAGLFAFRPGAMRAEFEAHLPDMVPGLDRLAEAWRGPGFGACLAEVFPTLQKVSIDYGVMERVAGALLLPLAVRWDDVGSWTALERLIDADDAGNVVRGPSALVEARGNIVSSQGGVVALKGVEGLIVVHTPDATLVCRRDDDQGVKALVERLAELGLEDVL